jgi:hypothetical protein
VVVRSILGAVDTVWRTDARKCSRQWPLAVAVEYHKSPFDTFILLATKRLSIVRGVWPAAKMLGRVPMVADHHLLFGLLALQTGLIDQAALFAGFHAWTRDKARPLAEHLIALGYIDAAHRPLLEGLAAAHLARHDGDVERSLAALPWPG